MLLVTGENSGRAADPTPAGRLGGIDQNLLVPLNALLEVRHVSRAAARVHLSQPAMSAALARLRRHFDDELLVRVAGSYELTPLAVRLQSSVATAVAALDDVWGKAGGFDPATSTRRFTVTASAYAMEVVLPRLWQVVAEHAPSVVLQIHPMPREMLTEADTLRTELLVCPLGFGLPGAHEQLFDDDFVCVVDARHHPGLAVSRTLRVDDLATFEFATTSFVTSLTTAYFELFETLAIPRRTRLITDEWAALPTAIEGTELVALLPRRLARRRCAAAPFVIHELPEHLAQNGFTEYLHWHSSRSDDRGIRWLRGRFHDAVHAD